MSGAREAVTVKATISVGVTVEVGVVVRQDDYEYDGGTTIIRGRMITDLPHPQK